jgi:hypothetical protein
MWDDMTQTEILRVLRKVGKISLHNLSIETGYEEHRIIDAINRMPKLAYIDNDNNVVLK